MNFKETLFFLKVTAVTLKMPRFVVSPMSMEMTLLIGRDLLVELAVPLQDPLVTTPTEQQEVKCL
jgi:hypothetical protein